MNNSIRIRLMIMMFLEFFVWGCWYATMGTYLSKIGFSGLEVGAAFSTVSWGAILSPFIIGMIADRFFSAEKVIVAVNSAELWRPDQNSILGQTLSSYPGIPGFQGAAAADHRRQGAEALFPFRIHAEHQCAG